MSFSTFHFREIEDLIYDVIFEADGKDALADELEMMFKQFRKVYTNDKELETIIRGTTNFTTDDLDLSDEDIADLDADALEELEKQFIKKFNKFSKVDIHEITRSLSFMYGIAYTLKRLQTLVSGAAFSVGGD